MFKHDPNHPTSLTLLAVTRLGLALIFAIIWRLLNSNFLPQIGEGATSAVAFIVAGFAFWFWSCTDSAAVPGDQSNASPHLPHIRFVSWHLVSSVVAIPAGRILFTLLPPWDNTTGAILGVLIGHVVVKWVHYKSHKLRFVHDRGTIVLSEQDARKRISAMAPGAEPRIKWAGCDIPGEIAEGNLLIAGTIGSGKTRMQRELMASVVPSIRPGSDRRLIVYDVKCDLLSELSGMPISCEVIVLNPFDKRSVAWDLAADIKTPNDARHFAESLIPPAKGEKDLFFITGARNIVAGVINKLNRTHPGKWNLRRLLQITAKRERLASVLSDTDLIHQYFEPPDTFSNIRNTIANVTVPLEPVAALWESAGRKVGLKEWVKTGDSILVLGGKEDLQASLQTINRVAIKMISTAFLSEPESPRRSRLWFFCDELKYAGRLDSLPALLNGRSKGIRCVLGFQDIEGLESDYGNREIPREILSRCSTVSVLKLTSAETAEWASKRTGEFERFEYMESKNSSQTDNQDKNLSEHLAKREAVLRSEFLNLPDFAFGNVHGFHIIKGVGGVFRSVAHYEFPHTSVPDFDPKPDEQQLLLPWGTSDDEWLAGDSSGGAATQPIQPKPDDTNLGSLGRVKF